MDEFLASPTAWLGCIFCVSSFWTIDMMFQSIRVSLRNTIFNENSSDTYTDGKEHLLDVSNILGIPKGSQARRNSHIYKTAKHSMAQVMKEIEMVQ